MLTEKELYDKVCVWLADYEDSSLLEESFDDVDAPDMAEFMLDEASTLLYEFHQQLSPKREET